MSEGFERTERDYSAGEAAELTGVSQVMQRDWRRHGFLEPSVPGKHVRFSLLEICIMALMKVQTDNGKAVSAAHWVAKMTADAAILQIEKCQVGVSIEGLNIGPAQRRKLIYELNSIDEKADATTRYIFLPANKGMSKSLDDNDEMGPTAYCFASLAEMESEVERDWVYGTIFDLQSFAMSLSFKLGEPLITYRLVEDDK